MDSSHGGMLAGYAIEGVLGQGGMGTVYRARHPRLPRVVAIKLLNQDVSADPELRARFDREADIVARLDHPGIVAVQDRGVENGQPWLAMQYVEGVDTSRLDPATVSVERAVRIVGEVAAALDYAHSRGVLHRDVKPANILLTTAQAGLVERAVLTDFGIARLLTANTQLTSTGTFTATLAYASPEQLSGLVVDHRSDQYSLACTLFALLSGRTPFAATDPGQVVAGHLARPVPPLGRPDVPPQLDAVIARAMAKNPAERFASAGEFAAAALQAVSGRVFAAPPGFQVASAPNQGWGTPHFSPPTVPQQGWQAAPGPQDAVWMRNPWPAACAMAVGFFVVLLVSSAVPSALPSIQRDLHAGSVLGWVSDAYALCATVPLLFTGRLGDRFGPRKIYLIGVALFMLGSLAYTMAASIQMLIPAMAVQGLGVALIIPQTMAVILQVFPPGKRGAALGLWGGCGGLAMLLAPFVGAELDAILGWRWVSLPAVPLGLIMIVLAATLVPALPLQRPRADPVGVLLSGAGVLLLVLSLMQGVQRGWTIWGPGLIAGLLVFGLFLFVQAGTPSAALIPKVVLRDRNWWLSSLLTLALIASLSVVLMVLAIHLQVGMGFAEVKAGLVLVPAALVTAIFSPILGYVADRRHPAILPAIGFTSAAASAAGITAAMQMTSPFLFALIGAVLGFALACLWGPLAAIATSAVPSQQSGTGAGTYQTTRDLGSLVGVTVVSAVISFRAATNGYRADAALHTALREAGLLAAAVLLVCALATALLTRRQAAPTPPAYAPFQQ
ncbi:MDR family MFS transporter [Nocardia nepalensis]|uniref:MDR family MFS transporter n=1 Tax=Nocardia nepalensis TaxID=3375448 RepID=UPI003B674523